MSPYSLLQTMATCKLTPDTSRVRSSICWLQRERRRGSERFNVTAVVTRTTQNERACICAASDTGTRPVVGLQKSSACFLALWTHHRDGRFVMVGSCVWLRMCGWLQSCNREVSSTFPGSFCVRLLTYPVPLTYPMTYCVAEGPVEPCSAHVVLVVTRSARATSLAACRTSSLHILCWRRYLFLLAVGRSERATGVTFMPLIFSDSQQLFCQW